ncbi:MAG: phosphoglucosamine mutase [Holosporaceae bacterium]|jgi:phosphoglucosamine mutase|nr:phosphoglucosamine mutase [Holosporaceae bacterium]
MSGRKLFGTDGIRGVANAYPITAEMCLKLAKGMEACNILKAGDFVIVGRDTRISGDMLEHALAAAFCSCGIRVGLLGIVPTPAVSILCRKLSAVAGIMISASHNPFGDNGVKIFNSSGCKLTDLQEAELEKIMLDDAFSSQFMITGSRVGRTQCEEHSLGLYLNKIRESFSFKNQTSSMRMVLDLANGVFSSIAPELLREYGFDVVSMHDSPDGININHDCGATNPQTLSRGVIEYQAQVGLAFDGDGDRVLLADENGNTIDGDHILAILAQSENFQCPELVSTLMSNLALEKYLASHGVKLARTAVGDRYISEYMQQSEATLGGEPSGHIIVKSHALTGDGLFAALKVLEYAINSGKKLSELNNLFRSYSSFSKNVAVSDKAVINDQKVIKETEKIRTALGNVGRLILRFSGTEPVIRLYLESENSSELKCMAESLAATIENVQGCVTT